MSTEDHTLFLEKVIEPEIPALSSGLRAALDTGKPYKFEPIDEVDLRLEVTQEAQEFRVKVQYDRAPASTELGWPAGIIVNKSDLLRFTNELETAFGELIADAEARPLH